MCFESKSYTDLFASDSIALSRVSLSGANNGQPISDGPMRASNSSDTAA